MLVCHSCHRHVRVEETACPFCATPVRTTAAPTPIKLGAMALVIGLGLFGCSTDGEEDSGPDDMTTNPNESSTGTETGEEGDGDGDMTGDGDGDMTGDGDGDMTGDGDGDMTGDGDGDTTGDADTDEGGSDYGGAPPPEED